MESDWSRRHILQVLGLAGATAGVGCSSLTGSGEPGTSESPSSNDTNREAPANSPTGTQSGPVIGTSTNPRSTATDTGTSTGRGSPTATNGPTTGTPAGSDTATQPGETPTDTDTDTDTSTGTAAPSDQYVMDVKPENGSGDSPVFTQNPSGREFREYTTDLNHNSLHENDSDHYIAEEPKWQTWLDTIPENDRHTDTKGNTQRGSPPFFDLDSSYDRFWHDKSSQYSQPGFASSDTVQQAMNWLHPFLLAWDAFGEDGEYNFALEKSSFPLGEEGWYQPSENEKFAAMFERAIEDHTETSPFFWSFDMYETKEGGAYDTANLDNEEVVMSERDEDHRFETIAAWDTENNTMMLVDTATNNDYDGNQREVLEEKLGTREERVSETEKLLNDDDLEDQIILPWAPSREFHPKTENSIFLPETGEGEPGGVTVEEYWHPFRFNGSKPSVEGLDYETAANITGKMFRSMVSSREDGDINNVLGEEADVAITNEYLADIAQSLANPDGLDNSGWTPPSEQTETPTPTSTPTDSETPGVEFENIYNQAKMLHELAEDDGNYVVFGDHENPFYAKISDDATIDGEDVLDQIWQDEAGEYNNFSQVYDPLQPVDRDNDENSQAGLGTIVGVAAAGAGIGTVANKLGYNSEEGLESVDAEEGILGRLLES